MSSYTIKKRSIIECADARKLQVLELECEQLKTNGIRKSSRHVFSFDTTVAVMQFQNGSAPMTKVLPISLMAKWARLVENDNIGITLTPKGVILECGGQSSARAHFFETRQIGRSLAFEPADVGQPLRLIAGKEVFELEKPLDAARIKSFRQQLARAKTLAALRKNFAKAKAACISIHGLCRTQSDQVREARKHIGHVTLPVALSVARRVQSIRRLIRATLKTPSQIPSWLKDSDRVPIQQALNRLDDARRARDAYQPPKRYDRWTVRAAKAAGMTTTRYARQQCEKYGKANYIQPQESRGPKWDKLREEVASGEGKVRALLERALGVWLASQGWHGPACNALISWSPGWRVELCKYTRARVCVRRWKTTSRELKERFNAAYQSAKEELHKLTQAIE